jgi:chromosome segregation ATPase
VEREGYPGWVVPAVILAAILAIAGLAVGWKGLSYAQDSRQSLSADLQSIKQGYSKDMDTVQQRLTQAEKTNSGLQDDLGVVTKRLRITQGQLKKSREDAQNEAQQIRDDESKKLADMDTQVSTQLATKASTDQVKVVSGEVGVVRTDLDTTKKDLQMARSELGTLIAKNHDDVETLRRLGERDYTEFTIAVKNTPQKVGDITIELRGTDAKKNQCNLAIVADDKRTEKRNRTINEPIFFYAHGARQPLEVVINQVEKNKVTGYLSVPKVMQPAVASGGN